METIYPILLTLAAIIIHHFNYYGAGTKYDLTPDGVQYLTMAKDKTVGVLPYGLRWLLPKICGEHLWRWQAVAWLSLLSLGLSVPLFVGGSLEQKLFAVALVAGLPGIFRLHCLRFVLVDGYAIALMMAGAVLFKNDHYIAAIAVSLLSGMVRETAPIFMAATTFSPLPLIGLISVGVRYLQIKNVKKFLRTDRMTVKGEKSFGETFRGLNIHAKKWLTPEVMLLPWGVCLLAAFAPSWPMALALALSYGQLIFAVDKARLYQWSFPLVVLSTVQVVPVVWMIPATIIHWFHPWNDRGT